LTAIKPEELVTIGSPFPAMELPSLRVWLERYKGTVVDESPEDFGEWMEWQSHRSSVTTFAVYRGESLAGYFEAIAPSVGMSQPMMYELQWALQCSSIFKQDLWKQASVAVRLCVEQSPSRLPPGQSARSTRRRGLSTSGQSKPTLTY
jgi:hypothetical protein